MGSTPCLTWRGSVSSSFPPAQRTAEKEDGGATSRGAIGEWESSPQHAEGSQNPQGTAIDVSSI